MRKIQCVYDRDNNFFFHLMSVAKVGYDNAYGEKYHNSMAPEDIAILKKYEKELTFGIFLKYHDDYCEKIWPDEEIRLAGKTQEWQKKFDKERLDEKAEKLVGIDSERTYI